MKYLSCGENIYEIDEKLFIENWMKDQHFRYAKDSTVIFIHQPRIKNLVNAD
ncbi:hypothetical protein [Neisseria iguanae]|uniref:hypothetical protein n=1 Tax=Neisseria iguanae TaxID=90242 RepID=UPI001475E332|nr:hypothetical protein [Neisseria iguanae]